MGSKRWRLANRKKPDGQLDRTDRFLSVGGTGRLSACSVMIPIEMDAKKAVLAAGDLASIHTRSFEVWWDASEKRMEFVLVAEEGDLDAYKQSFLNMYPNAAFSALEKTEPDWFGPPDPDCQIFDVGTRHGHYSTVFDRARAHHLMSRVARLIQLSRNAWIQFVFRRHSFDSFLRRHVGRLDSRALEIKRGNYLSTAEIITFSDKKPHDHPERGYDYTNNYAGLQKHATLKMQSAQVMMSIRGIIRGDREISLNFDEIESLPVENILSGHEHLTKFSYKIKISGTRKSPRRWRSA